MKTLDEIINERLIIEDDGYTDGRVSIQSIKDICILAQQQALKNAYENSDIHYPVENNLNPTVSEQSILNEQNIVK